MQRLDAFVRRLLHAYAFPSSSCRLTDVYPQIDASTVSARFVSIHSWLESRQIIYDCLPEFEGAMRLMSLLIVKHCPIGLFSDERGSGKTTLIKCLLANVAHTRLISSKDRRSRLTDQLSQTSVSTRRAKEKNPDRKFFVWIDDVQDEDTELIRSWMDLYSSSSNVDDFTLIITGQHLSSYSSRFSRHFVCIQLDCPAPRLINSMCSTAMENWLGSFSSHSIAHPKSLVRACLRTMESLFSFLSEKFNGLPWNLHHVQAVLAGLFLFETKGKRPGLTSRSSRPLAPSTSTVKRKADTDPAVIIVRLFIHELSRVVLDRLPHGQGQLL